MKYFLGFLFAIFFSSSILLGEAFYIKNYHVDIVQSEEGHFDVMERIQLYFTENRRGIIREIPVRYDVNGKDVKIKISNIQVEGKNWKSYSESGNQNIKIGDADLFLSGDQEYVIRYRVNHAITSLEDHHEFYWNVIGTKWDAEIQNVSFFYTFPESWSGRVNEFRAFKGSQGQKDTIQFIQLRDNRIEGFQSEKLYPYQGLTLAVNIPKELLSEQIISKDYSEKERAPLLSPALSKGLTAIPIAIALLLFGLWKRLGVKDNYEDEVADQFDVPDGMSPAEVGTFYDFRVNRRDIISLLPFWGEMGFLKMNNVSENSDDMYFEKVKEISADRPAYEREYFNSLFAGRKTILLSDLKESFYQTMNKATSGIKKEVLERELYHMPSYKVFNRGWMIAAFVVLLLIGIFTIALLEAVVAGIGLILIGVTCFILHFISPQKSAKGLQIHHHLKGLHNFLKDPDPETLAKVQEKDPNYLYRMFPYALAFGFDEVWAKRFEKTEMQPPYWYNYGPYYGHRTHSFGHFTRDFGAHKIEQVFYSQPASSGSSGGGFSGGSSGGGFGGGGGSSW